jgi:hypothetical protein
MRAHGARWSNGAERGARRVAQCFAPLRSWSAAIDVFGRCEVARGTVRTGVVFPGCQHGSITYRIFRTFRDSGFF